LKASYKLPQELQYNMCNAR